MVFFWPEFFPSKTLRIEYNSTSMKAPFAFVENAQTSLCFQAGATQWSMAFPALRPVMVPCSFGDKVEIIMRA